MAEVVELLRTQDDRVQVLKGIGDAFASAGSADELNEALSRWIRTALRARIFTYSLYVPETGSMSLRLLVSEGRGRTKPDRKGPRLCAFYEKRSVRTEGVVPGETTLFMPMVTCDEAFGVLELTAPAAAIDGSLETLEAIAAQAAIVLRNQREISELNSEVDAALRLNREREDRLDKGIALTAHEIKSPLLGTLAVMQVLEQMGAGGREEELLRQAQRQLEELASLTDELLRLTVGKEQPSRNVVDMSDLVTDVLISLSDEDRRRVIVRASSRAIAHADRRQLRNAFAHVFQHALRHTPKPERVEVRVQGGRDCASVTVIDRGPRIPAGERDNLFDPFVRDGGGTRSMDSLRLFAARRLVEAQGGEIVVESGTTGAAFTFTLPADVREAQSVPS